MIITNLKYKSDYMLSKAGLTLDFPTTQNLETDLHVRDYLRWACEYIIDYLGSRNIKAIVLSGSLALGEGSVIIESDGRVKLLSDIDIVIVVNKNFLTKKDGREPHGFFREKNNELNSALNSAAPQELLSPIDTVIWTHEEIKNWWKTPRIVTLQHGGSARIIWGDKDILSATFIFSQSDITDQDIFKLFNNRIAEQIFYLVKYKKGLESPECFVFHSAKAAVDTVLAVCFAKKCFKNGLLERLNIFKELCLEDQLGLDMVEWAEFWTKFKITPNLSKILKRFNTEDLETAALKAWNEVADFILKALQWVAKNRLGIDEERTESLVMRLIKCLDTPCSEDLFTNELLKKKLPIPEESRKKKLSALGSPRALMYAAAILLLAANGEKGDEKIKFLKIISNILPVIKPFQITNVSQWWWNLAEETSHLWNILIMDGKQ